jgi:hypothetical protein
MESFGSGKNTVFTREKAYCHGEDDLGEDFTAGIGFLPLRQISPLNGI